MRLEIDLAGDEQVNRTLTRFADRLDDASPAFEKIANSLRYNESRQFNTQGSHASGRWKLLAESTIARKLASPDPRIRANASTILVATGALRKSLTSKRDGEHLELIQPHQLTFGSTVPYGRYHQLGQGVPRRRPLEIREQDRKNMVRILQRFYVTGDANTPSSRKGS